MAVFITAYSSKISWLWMLHTDYSAFPGHIGEKISRKEFSPEHRDKVFRGRSWVFACLPLQKVNMWDLPIWLGYLFSSRAPLRKSTLGGLSVDSQKMGWLLLAAMPGQNPSEATAPAEPVEPREGNEVTNLAWRAKCRRPKPSTYASTCWLRRSAQQWIAFAELFSSKSGPCN